MFLGLENLHNLIILGKCNFLFLGNLTFYFDSVIQKYVAGNSRGE